MWAFAGLLREDWRAGHGTGLISRLFIANYRIGHYFLQYRRTSKFLMSPIYMLVLANYRIMSLLIGYSVPFSTRIGRRIRFQHGLHGIFISGLASIGNDCLILHQVTIGSNIGSQTAAYAAPQIGDRVFIGAGAKVIGGIEVGDDVMIGANALVIESVSPGSRCRAPVAIATSVRQS